MYMCTYIYIYIHTFMYLSTYQLPAGREHAAHVPVYEESDELFRWYKMTYYDIT